MNSNGNFDFFSMLPDVANCTAEGDQFRSAGIFVLADILETPLSELFQTAIAEHYRTCRLSYAACTQLVKILNEKGMNITFDTSIKPDIAFVPKSFSAVDAENQDIATAFDCLLADFWRIPSVEEIANETGLALDSLRNNTVIKTLLLEHQQVLNYIDWLFNTNMCDLPRDFTDLALPGCYDSNEINWDKYPYNLLLDVVPAVGGIKNTIVKNPELLARLIHRLDSLVYFDLSTEERNIIISQYVEDTIQFGEPTLQWGLEFWVRFRKINTIRKVRRLFQGGKLLATKGFLEIDAILEFSIEELGLSALSYNHLDRAYINTVAKLVTKTKTELRTVAKLRQSGLDEIVDKVHQLGMLFVDD